MKRLFEIIIVLAAVLVGIGVCQSLVPQRSWLISAGTLTAKNEQETQQFEGKLEAWLKTNGFERIEDPGGTHSWAGVHCRGETNEWYKGKLDDSGDFLIRASKSPRGEVQSGWNEFRFFHSWHVRGSRSKIEDAEKKSSELANNFLGLIEQTKVPNETGRDNHFQPLR